MAIDLSTLPVDLQATAIAFISSAVGYIVREAQQKLPFGRLAKVINKINGSTAFAFAKMLAEAAADEKLSDVEANLVASYIVKQLDIKLETQDMPVSSSAEVMVKALGKENL